MNRLWRQKSKRKTQSVNSVQNHAKESQDTVGMESDWQLNSGETVTSPQHILQLQRLIGNQATWNLLNRQSSTIQRDSGADWSPNPNFYRNAKTLNLLYSKNPPAPGWPHIPLWKRTWESGNYDAFADLVMDYQKQFIGIAIVAPNSDGVLDRATVESLMRTHPHLFNNEEAEENAEAGGTGDSITLPSADTTENVRQAMAQDVKVTGINQDDTLYLNMSGLITGMSYTKERMNSIFTRLSNARTTLKLDKLYEAGYVNNNATKRAEYDAAMIKFEEETGQGIRQEVHDYWIEKGNVAKIQVDWSPKVMDGLGTGIETLLEEMGDFGTEGNTSFTLSSPNSHHTTLEESVEQLTATANRVDDHKGWKQAFGSDYQKQFSEALRALVNKTKRQVMNQIGAGKKSRTFKGKQAQNIHKALTEMQTQLQTLKTEYTTITQRNQAQIEAFNYKYDAMASRVLDPAQVPLFVGRQREVRTMQFKDWQMAYKNRHESRMTYDEHAFISVYAQPTPLSEATKAMVPEEKFKDKGAQRCLEIYESLQEDSGLSESEAKVIATVGSGEGNFYTTQTVDFVRLSWGIVQFQGFTLMRLLEHIKATYPAQYEEYFAKYGILIGNPASMKDLRINTEREDRFADSQGIGDQREALDVGDKDEKSQLIVYDHNRNEWVRGNEGLWVMQRDPRYQALFSAFGRTLEGKKAQGNVAHAHYLKNGVREKSVTLTEGKTKKTVQVKDIINNEEVMFGLFDRKVHSGNIGSISSVVNAYMNKDKKKPKTIEDIENGGKDATAQEEFANWFRGYRGHLCGDVRWNNVSNLTNAGMSLSKTSYDGD